MLTRNIKVPLLVLLICFKLVAMVGHVMRQIEKTVYHEALNLWWYEQLNNKMVYTKMLHINF